MYCKIEDMRTALREGRRAEGALYIIARNRNAQQVTLFPFVQSSVSNYSVGQGKYRLGFENGLKRLWLQTASLRHQAQSDTVTVND